MLKLFLALLGISINQRQKHNTPPNSVVPIEVIYINYNTSEIRQKSILNLSKHMENHHYIQLLNTLVTPMFPFHTRLGCFYVTAILSWGWGLVDVDIETEADMRLGLMLGWDDVELKFSWNWVEVGVGEGFENCSGVYSWSWTNFIFYVSFNSDIWFWLNFVAIFEFSGPNG